MFFRPFYNQLCSTRLFLGHDLKLHVHYVHHDDDVFVCVIQGAGHVRCL